MSALEHWDDEWLPVLTRDERVQREREHERPQEPFSDAYLCGMPSRKRRCLRAARPPTTLDSFVQESVREATDMPAALDTSQIRSRLLDSVRTILRTRADNSEDFEPRRYAATATFLDQAMPNNKEAETKPDQKEEGEKTDEKME